MLNPQQKAQVGGFLVALLKGTADVGFASLPLLSLYKQAREEKVPLMDMVVAHPEAMDVIMSALKRQAKNLPPAAIQAMESVVTAARSAT